MRSEIKCEMMVLKVEAIAMLALRTAAKVPKIVAKDDNVRQKMVMQFCYGKNAKLGGGMNGVKSPKN